MSNLKRSNTLQTIKRAGTGAWKWINAEDAQINQNNPQGVSYFQRSNTMKKLNSSNSIRYRQRPNYGYNQLHDQSYDNVYNENSYTVNMNQVDSNASIRRPEPAREKKEKETDPNNRKRKEKIPSALYDPEVRKQLEQMKQHKPYFMYIITVIQIFMMVMSIYKYYTATGQFLAPINENIMIGPDSGPLIQYGARFLPCMKPTNTTFMECPKSIRGTATAQSISERIGQRVEEPLNGKKYCSLKDVCAFGMKEDEVPNQWFRFIVPIFLHAGIFHLVFNLTFQIRTGIQMEKDFGTWRIMVIYMASGIFGFVFGANYSGISSSVGCSGSLYGLLACLLLDLIQSWRLIVEPWKELFNMLIIIVFSLGIGLVPFIDNFAHVGGFITGILTGLIFMPSIIFSKRDLKIKRILMIASVFISIFMFIWAFKQFYGSNSDCKWCHYVNCLPIKEGWCKNYET
ncbi:rhomboid-domain-containing protein [Piromyces finnis]|uniref:Rhomboid-type serine protease n=1 Tax=Piromyces finnis TaxID=1754191 RepID=A0A1Y1VDW2_9FUNG|nr:rhomboid-domain-containing protein [Piromyces finnis]|eukprot:ORX52964.1 rhomboid-domain-containing protein [Piromyces finnis]